MLTVVVAMPSPVTVSRAMAESMAAKEAFCVEGIRASEPRAGGVDDVGVGDDVATAGDVPEISSTSSDPSISSDQLRAPTGAAPSAAPSPPAVTESGRPDAAASAGTSSNSTTTSKCSRAKKPAMPPRRTRSALATRPPGPASVMARARSSSRSGPSSCSDFVGKVHRPQSLEFHVGRDFVDPHHVQARHGAVQHALERRAQA